MGTVRTQRLHRFFSNWYCCATVYVTKRFLEALLWTEHSQRPCWPQQGRATGDTHRPVRHAGQEATAGSCHAAAKWWIRLQAGVVREVVSTELKFMGLPLAALVRQVLTGSVRPLADVQECERFALPMMWRGLWIFYDCFAAIKVISEEDGSFPYPNWHSTDEKPACSSKSLNSSIPYQ